MEGLSTLLKCLGQTTTKMRNLAGLSKILGRNSKRWVLTKTSPICKPGLRWGWKVMTLTWRNLMCHLTMQERCTQLSMIFWIMEVFLLLRPKFLSLKCLKIRNKRFIIVSKFVQHLKLKALQVQTCHLSTGLHNSTWGKETNQSWLNYLLKIKQKQTRWGRQKKIRWSQEIFKILQAQNSEGDRLKMINLKTTSVKLDNLGVSKSPHITDRKTQSKSQLLKMIRSQLQLKERIQIENSRALWYKTSWISRTVIQWLGQFKVW
jgi:hypothetical protein